MALTARSLALTTEELHQRHFAQKVLPLLKEKCLACHGDDPQKIKGDLDMRTRETLIKGGESGDPSIVPGKPDQSPLMTAVRRTDDDLAMPPKENDKLSGVQIEVLHQWIADGAVWPDEKQLAALSKAAASNDKWNPEDGLMMKTSGGLSADWTKRRYKPENVWAYQPLAKVIPPKTKPHPIDALLDVKMQALGVTPAPLADRRTLIRRATFDLTGLPPTPSDIAAFLSDPLPDSQAFSKVVERLLASPQYGEHWGRHWLDVVRYADSSGFANDYERGNTWRYRDYVIRSFNEDKPYDGFIMEQIAGDEMAVEKSKAEGGGRKAEGQTPEAELLIATGMLRMGPWELTGMEVAKVARQRFLDDVTDVVAQTFLSHTLQCARCHDHKFDPIPTRDYYSFQACFATTQLVERPAAFLPTENVTGFEEKQALLQRRDEHLATLKRLDDKSLAAAPAWFAEKKLDRAAWDEAVAQAAKGGGGKRGVRKQYTDVFDGARNIMATRNVPESQYPPKQLAFGVEDFGHERIARKGLERIRWELERYEPVAFAVYSGRTPEMKAVIAPLKMPMAPMTDGELEETCILPGGDPFSPKDKVKPGVLSVLGELGGDDENKAVAESQDRHTSFVIRDSIQGRRLDLAKWIASPANPLTTRSIVNRIWQWHFGQAIAGNPNNFGGTGKKPSQPELLDWLAQEMVNRKWSIKEMHRLIMSSEAYRRSADHPDRKQLAEKDPEAVTCAVFPVRRLRAEELRDAMLAASGELNLAMGGIPARPEINLEAALQPRQVMGTFAAAWQPNPLPSQRHRRSVYALKIRGLHDPFMEVFNEPSPEFSCEGRDASNVTPQVFSLFNSAATYDRAVALALRVQKECAGDRSRAVALAHELTCGTLPTAQAQHALLDHWKAMTERHRQLVLAQAPPPKSVVREAVEENTGEKFTFTEQLHAYDTFVPDKKMADVDADTRGLAEVCLVLLNSNEFAFVY
jgi:hypothetical protein